MKTLYVLPILTIIATSTSLAATTGAITYTCPPASELNIGEPMPAGIQIYEWPVSGHLHVRGPENWPNMPVAIYTFILTQGGDKDGPLPLSISGTPTAYLFEWEDKTWSIRCKYQYSDNADDVFDPGTPWGRFIINPNYCSQLQQDTIQCEDLSK